MSDISKHLLIYEELIHICEVFGKAFRHIKNKELYLKRSFFKTFQLIKNKELHLKRSCGKQF